jgi:hypothetical protein
MRRVFQKVWDSLPFGLWLTDHFHSHSSPNCILSSRFQPLPLQFLPVGSPRFRPDVTVCSEEYIFLENYKNRVETTLPSDLNSAGIEKSGILIAHRGSFMAIIVWQNRVMV